MASILHLKRPAGRLLLKSPQDFWPRPPPRHMSSDNFWTTKFAALRYAVAWLGYAWMRLVVLPAVPLANGARPRTGASRLLALARTAPDSGAQHRYVSTGSAARGASADPGAALRSARLVDRRDGDGLVRRRAGRARARGCRGSGAPRGRARQRQGRHSVLGTLHDVRVLLARAAPALHEAVRNVQVAAQSRDESDHDPRARPVFRHDVREGQCARDDPLPARQLPSSGTRRTRATAARAAFSSRSSTSRR